MELSVWWHIRLFGYRKKLRSGMQKLREYHNLKYMYIGKQTCSVLFSCKTDVFFLVLTYFLGKTGQMDLAKVISTLSTSSPINIQINSKAISYTNKTVNMYDIHVHLTINLKHLHFTQYNRNNVILKASFLVIFLCTICVFDNLLHVLQKFRLFSGFNTPVKMTGRIEGGATVHPATMLVSTMVLLIVLKL